MASYDDRDGFIWMDGKLVEWRSANVHILTHALHYASSVFEGERCYNGKIFKGHEHSLRLLESGRLLDMPIPYTAEEIDAAKEEGWSPGLWGTVEEAQLHLWLGTCVSLMAIWSIKTGIKPGLDFHLLGGTLMALMFGPHLAMIGFAVVLAGVTLAGAAGWQGFGANLLVMAAVPVLFSDALHKTSQRKLPNHLFVYLLLDAFFCSAVAIVLSGLAATLLLGLGEVYRWSYLTSQHLPFYVLLGWSEAMITGRFGFFFFIR